MADLRAAEAEGRRAADRVAEGEKDLADLAAAEVELARLKPDTARLPEVTAELERLDEDRRRAEERDRGRRQCLQDQRRISDIEGEVWDVLEELDGGDEEVLPGFHALFDLDGQELLREGLVVLDGVSAELERAEARHEELRELVSKHKEIEAASEEERAARRRYEESRDEANGIREELEDFSGGEDLERRARDLREEEEKLKEVAAHHRGRANADEREAKNVDKAREAIDSGAEDHCPTCHRGFEGGEQEEISDTLKRQAASLRRRAATETAEAEKLTASAAETAGKLQRLETKLDRWRVLRETLALAANRAADRLETAERLAGDLRRLREDLGDLAAPTEEDLEAARARRERLRRVRDVRPTVSSLAAEHSRLTERVAELMARLEELAGLSYDPDEHRRKREEKDRLERSQGRVEELARRLETRGAIEEALREARERVEEAVASAGKLQEEVSALGFDEAAYEEASRRVSAAEERASTLRDAREGLGGDWKDTDHRIERAKTEIKRLDDDRKLANERASAAARMDEMDALFTEFFRSLTARARPMLEAEASGLIRELTDGRYESMEFDENYRVRLLDRFDDSYAIERFSGGEADVASLSARVALSRLVAARGGNTLGFLVLDEVFGSLDAGRRNNVLLALERLKRSFGQIFIISHVGEVQESALVDEVWLVEEDEEGKSIVRRMDAQGGTPESLVEAGVLRAAERTE
jgi:exonuclease SbcC